MVSYLWLLAPVYRKRSYVPVPQKILYLTILRLRIHFVNVRRLTCLLPKYYSECNKKPLWVTQVQSNLVQVLQLSEKF